VSRTNDPEKFFNHEDFIQPDTKSVTICLYIGNSRRSKKHIFLLKDGDTTQHTLAGIDRTISEKIVLERDKWEYEQLKKEYEKQAEQLAESEEYSDQLMEKIKELEAEKQSRPNKITDTIIGLAGAYLSKNPNALNGIPLIGDLLGGSNPNPKEILEAPKTEPEEPQVEASFEEAPQEALKYTGTITETDTARFFKALIPLFPEQYREKVSIIIKYMHCNHHVIGEIHDLLADAANQKGNPNGQNQQKKAA